MHTYICNKKRNLTAYNIFIHILTVSVQTWPEQARDVHDIVHIGKL
jgi:hypothetical protein